MSQDLQAQLDALKFRMRMDGKSVREAVYAAPISENVHLEKVIDAVKKRPTANEPNRLHIGVAGLFNLELASHTRPDALLLLDYNSEQEKFWEIVIKCLRESPDRVQFMIKLNTSLRDEHYDPKGIVVQDPDSLIRFFQKAIGTWLDDDAFTYLKDLAANHKIMRATIDLAGQPEPALELGRFIQRKNFYVDTCYWSNIGQSFEPRDDELHLRGTEQPVFPKEAVYRNQYYDQSHCSGTQHWMGEEYLTGTNGERTRLNITELPVYERFLRNISSISGERGMHILTSNAADKLEYNDDYKRALDKEPERKKMIYERIIDVNPILFDGPPRRTPQQWAKREEARAQHDQAQKDGRGVY